MENEQPGFAKSPKSLGIIPYTSILIDACSKDFFQAALRCAKSCDRQKLITNLETLWKSQSNGNSVLPCLSVRTGFDLFLRVMQFPYNSEVVMSAINIPDMVAIVKYHGLKVVPLDIDTATTAPKIHIFEKLITPKTKLLVLAYIYGKWFDSNDIIDIANRHGIMVIEDCAEGFHGFKHMGNPRAELSLFSFGVIKYATSFGGAIAKVKDVDVYHKMKALYMTYKVQTNTLYLFKLLKYFAMYFPVNIPAAAYATFWAGNTFNFDVQNLVVRFLRGFPDKMIERIRYQPSTALLDTMWQRQSKYTNGSVQLGVIKGDYVTQRLPSNLTPVGKHAPIQNYWLFPVVVENPDEMLAWLHTLGVYAYRGATQLSIVEPYEPPPLLKYTRLEPEAPLKHATDEDTNYSHTKHTYDHFAAWSKEKSLNSTSLAQSQNSSGGNISTDPDWKGLSGLTSCEHVSSCNEQITSGGGDRPPPQSDGSKAKSTAYGDVCDNNPHLKPIQEFATRYPHEARYIIDHIIYLPVNKNVPIYVLEQICERVHYALAKVQGNGGVVRSPSAVKLKSNL